MTDDKIICDKCWFYQQQPSGTSETCHANKTGSQVIPWLTKAYIDKRFCGNTKNCKGFNNIALA